jgi:hypothetical protein
VGLINEAPCHGDLSRDGGIVLTFVTSAVDGGEWSFTTGTHREGGWVSSGAGPSAVDCKRMSSPDSSVVHPMEERDIRKNTH